jgi:hypothetical protein
MPTFTRQQIVAQQSTSAYLQGNEHEEQAVELLNNWAVAQNYGVQSGCLRRPGSMRVPALA